MNLPEFINYIDLCNAETDSASIVAALEALAEDRELLSDHLLKWIQEGPRSQSDTLYNSYAFTLYECDRFIVRLLIWLPADSQEEADTFIYGLIHSHDFELFVTGYGGDGYRSVMRSISGVGSSVAGIAPEFGEISSVRVSRGTSYHMRAFRDVHHQLPPDQLSASLSLIMLQPAEALSEEAWCYDENYRPQYSGIGAEERELYDAGLSRLEQLVAPE
ncbi:transposase [Pseudomonas sp. Irchel 3A5]|uniref:transposase n=1 Tax=Pseudomonas sp. Irchel 3A5 TaxID=2008911 RepID=UPI000BA36563|nr:transposase [Pseudomonas sp. Irchel 3A5]